MQRNSLRFSLLVVVTITLCGSFAAFAAPTSAAAQTTPPACIDGQYNSPLLSGLNINGTYNFYNNSDGQPCTPTAAQIAARPTTGIARPADALCGLSNFSFNTCIWIPMMSAFGPWFLTLGGAALVFAGVIFDWLVQAVIINFGATLNAMGALGAITTGWTIFRDLSNIVIIGMFTFIAIATILGSTDYGYKKMLSRVLIVAVLINFSLIFTKIIIDVGNVTAYQIYSAVSTSPQFSQPQTSGGTQQSFDIASAFLRPMGITSVWNTQGVTTQFAQTTGSGFQGFMFGLVGGLLLLMLAIVLLYGCFLIASRAILLVILMVTASIAFASHLIPKLSESEYGWSGWWKTLINASLFAPLLMIFLAISLLIINGASGIANQIGATGGGGSGNGGIGAAVFSALSSPTTAAAGNGWTVIMLYIFGIGLLFASFRLSSSFASSISGFDFAQATLSTPLAALNRYGVSPFLQNWRGRRNLEKSEKAGEQAREDREKALNTGNFRPLINSLRKQEKYQNRAKRSYDITNTAAGRIAANALGVPKVLAGENKSNFADSSKAAAKAAADKAAGLATLTDAEKKKIRDEAYDSKMQNKDRDKEVLRKQEESQRKQLEVMKKSADQQASVFEQQKQTMQKQLETEQKTQTDLKTKHENILKSISEELGKATKGTSAYDDVQKRYDAAKGNRDAEMAQQDDKIKSVHQAIQTPVADLQKKIDEIRAPVEKLAEDSKITQQKLQNFDKDFENEANDVAKRAVDQATVDTHETAGNLSAVLAQPRWQQTLGINPGKDNVTVNQARDMFKKKTGNKRLVELAKALAEETKNEETKPEEKK